MSSPRKSSLELKISNKSRRSTFTATTKNSESAGRRTRAKFVQCRRKSTNFFEKCHSTSNVTTLNRSRWAWRRARARSKSRRTFWSIRSSRKSCSIMTKSATPNKKWFPSCSKSIRTTKLSYEPSTRSTTNMNTTNHWISTVWTHSCGKSVEHDPLIERCSSSLIAIQILNKAFRIPEIDVLFKVRLFIQHLNQFIVSSSWRKANIRTVYRSTWLTDDQIDSLKKHADLHGLISFSGFLRASLDRPKTSSSNRHRTPTDKRKQVFFRIELSSNDSFIVQDDQVLFSLSVVGQIENFTKDNDGLVQLQLKLVSSDDQSLERILEPVRKEIRAPYPSLRVVKLFIELKEYSRAVLLGQQLLAQFNGARKDNLLALARLYHSLGTTLYETEEYEQALDVINKSHELYLRFLPEDAPQLSPTWNNMGSIYLKQGKIDLALQYHERALNIQLKSPSPDLPSIISYSNNIGGVYLKLERYDEALLHFKRALQIEEQTLPKNHHDLAGTYHRIGGVYFRQNNHEKALEYYDKTLEVELASLPDDHPTVAVTYHNRGTALEGLGRLEEALDSAEKAVQRLLKTLSKDHPQVKMNQSYADRLKQKLWVKQLFSSGNWWIFLSGWPTTWPRLIHSFSSILFFQIKLIKWNRFCQFFFDFILFRWIFVDWIFTLI